MAIWAESSARLRPWPRRPAVTTYLRLRPRPRRLYATRKQAGGGGSGVSDKQRNYAKGLMKQAMKEMKGGTNTDASPLTEALKQGMPDLLLPSSFVALPLRESPRAPRDFARYQWERLKSKVAELASWIGIKILSMPTWLSRPRFRIDRARLVATAVALHRTMGVATAQGDKETLQAICTPALYQQLAGAIDRRGDSAKGYRHEFCLTEYVERPRLCANTITSSGRGDEFVQQVTVSIYAALAVQSWRRGSEEAAGRRAQCKREYLVMTRRFNRKTFAVQPWRIWGTRGPTTLEDWEKDKMYLRKMTAQAVDMNAQG